MKRDNVNYLTVGCFVLTMIAAFLVLMYQLTGRTGPTEEYHVFYKNVAGLKFGTGVFYEGYRIGQIDRIEPVRDQAGVRYKLSLTVARGWRIPDDSVARIVASGLISAVNIEIEEGQSRAYIAPGGEISGAEQTDLFVALNQAAADFHALSSQGVMPVLDNLNQRITEIGAEVASFRRDELAPFMKTLNARVNDELLADARRVLTSLDQSARHLETILGGENQQRIASFLVHIDDVAGNVNDLITRIESTRSQTDQVLLALGRLVTENDAVMSNTLVGVESSVQEMRRSLGTINDHLDTILYHIEGSAQHLHEFTREVRENPARLLRGSRGGDAGEAP